jgi:signal transduction histidine kinase
MITATAVAPEPAPLRILHVHNEDEAIELDAGHLIEALQKGASTPTVTGAQTALEFERELQLHRPDVIIASAGSDPQRWNGMQAIEILCRRDLDIPLIIVSRPLGDMVAVECMKRGAADYVLRDELTRLPAAVEGALERTRQRQLQHQAEQALAWRIEELARSNADLEQFAHVASHDLQEPLRMVASYTQLLGERYRGKLDPDADKFIDYACEGALRMKSLIQDLLAFSKIGTHNAGAALKLVDSNLALDEALINLGPAIKEGSAVITRVHLPAVLADRWQLARVFQNLIGNAIKFRAAKPPEISVQAAIRENQWLFSVRDNGIGIAPEHAENIFVVLRRLHAREEYAGNGIGLAICKKIVEHYGGKIWVEAVEAENGGGSVFKFILPGEGTTA